MSFTSSFLCGSLRPRNALARSSSLRDNAAIATLPAACAEEPHQRAPEVRGRDNVEEKVDNVVHDGHEPAESEHNLLGERVMKELEPGGPETQHHLHRDRADNESHRHQQNCDDNLGILLLSG